MTIQETIDPKVVERIKKLLNLAKDGGATEAEASLAMEKAEEIMAAHNLSMAEIEARGESPTEDRLKDRSVRKANYRWQRWIMIELGEAYYCHVSVTVRQVRNRGGMRDLITGYQLIGRVSNVAGARNVYEYLLATIARLSKEYGEAGNDKQSVARFAEGMAHRLSQRIRERHARMLREQRDAAEFKKREEATRSRHPSAAPSNALVVVLADYAEAERDYNNDIKNGWPLGKTRQEREARERAHHEANQRMADLIASGIDGDVAFDIAHLGWSRERAEEYEARARARAAEAAAAGSPGSTGFRFRSRKTWNDRVREQMEDRLRTAAARDGARKAEEVGLDPQVGQSSTTPRRRLS